MTYFVTGATGFIGRHLVERLLEARRRHPRARARGLARAARRADRALGPGAGRASSRSIGDLAQPQLGVDDDQVDRARAARSTTSSTSPRSTT